MFMATHLTGFGVGSSALLLDGIGPTGAWSMSRKLLSNYAGAFYTDAGGGAISAWLDQSGSSRNLSQGTSGSRPSAATAGGKSRACADFDGTDDLLTGATMSNFIAAGTGYLVVSALADVISTDVTSANNGYQNDGIISDDGANVGILLRSTGPLAIANNFDGNSDDTGTVATTTGAVHVYEWRHEGGNLYLRVDGGTEASVASGNTTLTASMIVGRNYSNQYFDGKVFEAAAFNVVPSLSQRDALVSNMLAWAQ
jgi:hypothetical protein